MPKRIPFHVVYATSEDASYPARELGSQGPAARGWRSAGPPPHELLLRLTSAAQLHRLQLLAHHQLIPSWVEVLVSGGLVSEGAATPCGATYSSVGKIALAKPTPQARTRELRSASLPEPTVARFVKLRLSGPHPPGNPDDQVALMAVNVLGVELEESSDKCPSPERTGLVYSPYDDLAFVMYVENEIADLVRSLDERKKTAVAEERFEYARRLKSAGAALTSAGIRVGRWQLRKRTAAAKDDFEQARQMRDRVGDALMGIKEDPELCRLFEENGPDPRNDSSMPQDYDFSHHLSPSVACMTLDVASPAPDPEELEEDNEELIADVPDARTPTPTEVAPEEEIIQKVEEQKIEVMMNVADEETRRETDSPRRSITPNAANGGTLVRRRNKSAGPRSTFEAYEESLLPALRHSHTNEHLRSKEEDSVQSGASAQQPPRAHKLSERERKLLALPILIFGLPLVEKFYSKNYLEKEEALSRLRSELTSPSDGSAKTSPNKTARAAAVLLQRSLRDKVFSVYCLANDVVKTLFLDFMPDRVCAAEVGRCLEKLLPELLRACGDPAPRVHSTAQHTVLTVADCDHVRSLNIIPQQLVRPAPASMHPRLALSRLQMLEQLLNTHGISTDKNSGLTVRRLAECGAAGAQHAAGAVRAAAERVLLRAYERSPRVVRAQLPPDDAVTRRNLIYRHLFQQFDRIDMQKILNKAPSEDQVDQSEDSVLETASISQSARTCATNVSGMTTSMMTSSLGASSYSLKSMASSVSGATLAPSSLSGSLTTRTKSSLRKTPTKKYSPGRKDFSNIGYNKLRLDSAVSPKHSPNTPSSTEKVHFEETRSEQVILRRTHRSTEKRHSMIHYDHEPTKPDIKNRPVTVYEPLHLDYQLSPRASRSDIETPPPTMESMRQDFSNDFMTKKYEYLDSPRMVSGLRSLQLEETGRMEESGYYSPENVCDQGRSEGVEVTPEQTATTTCSWCGRRVLSASMEAHYWRRCVLLARCPHCRLTVEARSLHAHLLEECSMSEGAWKRCKKCGAALGSHEGGYHVNCIPVSMDEWKCPYCLINILARDLPWQRHLTQCSKNPRVALNN